MAEYLVGCKIRALKHELFFNVAKLPTVDVSADTLLLLGLEWCQVCKVFMGINGVCRFGGWSSFI